MHDLLFNGTILISFVAIVDLFIKDFDFDSTFSVKHRILAGIITGALGCLLMIYSVEALPSVIVDYRNISIILASMYGGLLTSIITAVAIGGFRILWFGLSTASVLSLFLAIIMAAGCSFIHYKIHKLKPRCYFSAIFTVTAGSIGFIILVKDPALLPQLLLSYAIGSFLIMFLLCNFINSLAATNRLYKKYKDESSIDFLTGLNNVRQFDRIYNELTSNIVEKDERLSLLFIDVDYFKKINDTFGHAEGDIILKELGQVLIKTCRHFDIISRNGGEEFSALLLDCHQQQAANIAERIRRTIEKHPFNLSNGKTVNITVSIGVATYPDTTTNFNDLLKEADKALYEAKQAGRNNVVCAEKQAGFIQ